MALKDLLDPKCRQHWLRLWSNQLAILFGAAMAFIVENPHIAMGYIDEIPQPWRSIGVFLVTAVVPIIVRIMRQPKLDAPPPEPVEGE